MALNYSKCNEINKLKRDALRRESFKKTDEFKREFKLRKIESNMKFWSKINTLTLKG